MYRSITTFAIATVASAQFETGTPWEFESFQEEREWPMEMEMPREYLQASEECFEAAGASVCLTDLTGYSGWINPKPRDVGVDN